MQVVADGLHFSPAQRHRLKAGLARDEGSSYPTLHKLQNLVRRVRRVRSRDDLLAMWQSVTQHFRPPRFAPEAVPHAPRNVAIAGGRGALLAGPAAPDLCRRRGGKRDAETYPVELIVVDGAAPPPAGIVAEIADLRRRGAKVVAIGPAPSLAPDAIVRIASNGQDGSRGPRLPLAVPPHVVPLLPAAGCHDGPIVCNRMTLARRAGAEPVCVPWPLELPLRRDVVEALSVCQSVRIDDPPSSDPLKRANVLIALAAGGVPVQVRELRQSTCELLGSELAELCSGRLPASPSSRERLIFQLRSAVLASHSSLARVDQLRALVGLPPRSTPSVSVVLASRRPQMLDRVVLEVQRQSYPQVELIVALHGPGFPVGIETSAWAKQPGIKLLRVPTEVPLGAVLRQATDMASGTLISKMDDDDWYDTHHLRDLVLGRQFTGAELVGKMAEFVYLTESDVTLRCHVLPRERLGVGTLAGGTLLLSKRALDACGGWAPVQRCVDKALVTAVIDNGLPTAALSGFGYVHHRHGDHTWQADDACFRRRTVGGPWPGRAWEVAGVR